LDNVTQPAEADSHEVTCPHCKKSFEAPLLEGSAERYNGFKCPHCRLFVPLERASAAKPQS
jgi:DNA-directed RNA polymerase subunit RPC12/RpoP